MVFSAYVKQRIIYFHQRGYRPPTISVLLQEESISASRVGIAKFLMKYELTGSVSRAPGSGRPTKISTEIKAIVEDKMREDDETTASQLHKIHQEATKFPVGPSFVAALHWGGPSTVSSRFYEYGYIVRRLIRVCVSYMHNRLTTV